ncbi:hypothetical protein [[Limnothrix rosea] IAM M-220]|nr:hypothetical protein [[Limnothrix rosea] IAM M-220]
MTKKAGICEILAKYTKPLEKSPTFKPQDISTTPTRLGHHSKRSHLCD